MTDNKEQKNPADQREKNIDDIREIILNSVIPQLMKNYSPEEVGIVLFGMGGIILSDVGERQFKAAMKAIILTHIDGGGK